MEHGKLVFLAPIIIQGELLTVQSRVRFLAGKRVVYRGLWKQKSVFCKIYQDKDRAKVHWQREVDGIRALTKAGIDTAFILYAGYLKSIGHWIVLLEEIPYAITLKDIWQSLQTDEDCMRTLEELAGILAKHHANGILQKDMHLDNFVSSNGVIFTLDGAGIRSKFGEIPLKRALNNLALLMAQLSSDNDRYSALILEHYFTMRSAMAHNHLPHLNDEKNASTGVFVSTISKSKRGNRGYSTDAFRQRIRILREHRLREYMSKIFRTCSGFVKVTEGKVAAIINRAFDSEELRQLVANPDTSMQSNLQLLKQGNTCTVWKVNIENKLFVIKRYNSKGFLHRIKQLVTSSRAKISWKNSNMLLFFGIRTPMPVALITNPTGLLNKQLYFVYAHIDSPTAYDWFNNSVISDTEKYDMAAKVSQLLLQMKNERIRHGDLKATNILVSNTPHIIDLDSVRRYRNILLFNLAWKRSIQRFMKNWASNQSVAKSFSQNL